MAKLAPLLIVFALVLGLTIGSVLVIRWTRKSSQRGAVVAWGVQLFGAGMNPLPPPQEQLESVGRQTRLKKDAESGDPQD